MKTCVRMLVFAAVLLLFAACRHQELCYHHPHTANVRIDVDWSRFEPYETPTGMTLQLYPEESLLDGETREEMGSQGTIATSEGVITHLTNTTSHAVLTLPVNRYHVLVFNQSTTEFGSFSFRDMEDLGSAVVVMRSRSRWYRSGSGEGSGEGGSDGSGDEVATEPEWLGVGNCDDARVTQAMIDAEAVHPGTVEQKPPTVIAEVTPHNVIYTVKVRIYMNNIYNLRSARASMTGLAEGYLLTRDRRLSTTVTHLLEAWSMTQDEADPAKGYIDAAFTCFGLPDGHTGAAAANRLTLEALLVDNKTIERFEFSVGDLFELDGSDPNRMTYSVVIPDPVTLSDAEPDPDSNSGGGFDVTVDDWGDEINYDIPL